LTKPAVLALEDGSLFHGVSIGADGTSVGEVVFNTALTGYQEILTDPSYCKQIVTLTYPHIGNVGCNDQDEESSQIWAQGLIIREVPIVASNWRSQQNLPEYLQDRGVVAIAGIDTRRLTRILRSKGAQAGCIMAGEGISDEDALSQARSFPGLQGMDLAQHVTTQSVLKWQEGGWYFKDGTTQLKPHSAPRFKVVAYDFGIKRNIMRMLVDRGCELTVVPAKTSVTDVLAYRPDGIFLSNGPGDPEPCDYAIQSVNELLGAGIPIFGICLGHQILALACGAKTLKMKFGHHGANHPVLDLDTKTVMITSQNHGFAVDESSLPDNVRATHRSLFDNSLQGIERTDVPAFSFQGHPEASPGPHDVAPLFDRFIAAMSQH